MNLFKYFFVFGMLANVVTVQKLQSVEQSLKEMERAVELQINEFQELLKVLGDFKNRLKKAKDPEKLKKLVNLAIKFEQSIRNLDKKIAEMKKSSDKSKGLPEQIKTINKQIKGSYSALADIDKGLKSL